MKHMLVMLSRVYCHCQSIKTLSIRDEDKISRVMEDMNACTEVMMKIMKFIWVNMLILNHLLAKIDMHTLVFENPSFQKFFKIYYNRPKSMLRRLIEHPELVRCYFQMRYNVKKLEDVVKVRRSIILIDTNEKENELQNVEEMPNYIDRSLSFISKEKSDSERIDPEYRGRLHTIKSQLIAQTKFFKLAYNQIFYKFGIETKDYCNIKKLEEIAKQNFDNDALTEQEFIHAELHSDRPRNKDVRIRECYSSLDLSLVYFHTFLYELTYYGIVSTSYIYNEHLEINTTSLRFIQSITPVASTFSGLFFNYITLNNKYRYAYFIALSTFLCGTILYYLAYTFRSEKIKSIIILMVGQTLIGMGGARLMTRKFIAINVEIWAQSNQSTILVTVTDLGICLGPGLATLLQFIKHAKVADTQLFPGNVLAFALIFIVAGTLVVFIAFFKGSAEISKSNKKRLDFTTSMVDMTPNDPGYYYDNSLMNFKYFDKQKDTKGTDNTSSSTKNANVNHSTVQHPNGRKQRPMLSAFFPNNATVVVVFCFFIIKLVQDVYFLALPRLAREYYKYSTQWVGWFFFIAIAYGILSSVTKRARGRVSQQETRQ